MLCIPTVCIYISSVGHYITERTWVQEGTQLGGNHLKEAVVNSAIIIGSHCSGHIESDLCEMI